MPAYKQQTLAVSCLLYTATMWGLIWYPLRHFSEQGLNGVWSTFFIYLGTLVVAIPLLRSRFSELYLQPGWLFALFIFSGVANTAFILAVIDGQVVRVLLLFYLSPIWTMLLGKLILDESIQRSSVVACAFALVGVIIMLWDENFGVPFPQSTADWLALLSGVAFAWTSVCTRKLQRVSIQTKSVASWLGVIAVAGIFLLFDQHSIQDVPVATIYIALALGVVFVVSMTIAVVYGVTHLPVQRSAIIMLFEIVVGAVSAYWLANEVMTLQEWVGGALVISAAIFIARKS